MKEKKQDQQLIISYLTLRRTLGVLGIAMPFLMFFCSQFTGMTPLQGSISSYYFTNVRDVFVGILCVFSLFLITYKGYDRLDDIISDIAGVFALFIALFPAMSEGSLTSPYLFFFLGDKLTTAVHFISAGSFFLLLAGISFFLFTKTGAGVISGRKRIRNKIYRICGIIIFLNVVLLGIFNLVPMSQGFEALRPVFFVESFALFAFGFSWLVKGEAFIRDK